MPTMKWHVKIKLQQRNTNASPELANSEEDQNLQDKNENKNWKKKSRPWSVTPYLYITFNPH